MNAIKELYSHKRIKLLIVGIGTAVISAAIGEVSIGEALRMVGQQIMVAIASFGATGFGKEAAAVTPAATIAEAPAKVPE